MPHGEHSAEEGIFQHLSCYLHDGCTLKAVCWVGHLPAHWLCCVGCRHWCSPAHRKWNAGEELDLLQTQRDTPHPAQERSVLEAGGDCRWTWTRPCALAQTVLTHLLCGEQPCLWVVGEGVKVPCRVRREQPAGIPLAAGAGFARVMRSRRCCTMVLACGTVPCLSILPALVPPAFAEGRGSFFS